MIETQNIKLTKILVPLILLIVALSATPAKAESVSPAPVSVTVEGKPLTMPVPPTILENRTMIALRSVGEAVGGVVEWNQEKHQATVRRQSDTLIFTVGEQRAVVNGVEVTLPVAAQLINSTTMVPLRFIAEALGGEVEWDAATRTVNILRRPTAISGLTYRDDIGKSTLTLSLSEPLLSVTPHTEGNHLSLDLYPARVMSSAQAAGLPDELIKDLQLKTDGRTVHLEAELGSEPVYSYSLSPDGKTLSVSLDHSVTGFAIARKGRIPELTIATTGKVEYTDFALAGPNRVVVDIKNAHLSQSAPASMSVGDPFLKQVRSALFSRNPDTVRVVLDLPASHSYQIVPTDKGLVVRFVPTITAVTTQRLNGTTRLTLTSDLPIDTTVTALAAQKQIRIDLPQGQSGVAGNSVKPSDGAVSSISLAPGGTPDSTTILVQLPYYLGHTVLSKNGDSQIVVDLVTSPVYGKRIWIDAGHGKVPGGADDPGSIGRFYKTVEKLVNLSVALELQRRLQAAGAVVFMTRTGDEGVDFRDRPALVNKLTPPVDLFLSIHHNSANSTTVRGTETYYWTTNAKSKVAAQLIHPTLVKNLGFPDRSVRSTNYYVITATQAPSVLVELGYLSNADEEKVIATNTYPATAAEAIKLGIFDYFWQEIGR